jgi:hypothetical protein
MFAAVRLIVTLTVKKYNGAGGIRTLGFNSCTFLNRAKTLSGYECSNNPSAAITPFELAEARRMGSFGG